MALNELMTYLGRWRLRLYFQYLAEKDPAVLQGVFIHNEHDIVTLAALTIHFGKLLSPDADLLTERDRDIVSGNDLDL